jgi:hypothetical protein
MGCRNDDCCGPDHTSCYVNCPDAESTLTNASESGGGEMCPAAPPGCFEAFMANDGETSTDESWKEDDECAAFIGANLMCDQNPEDAEEVEESGTGWGFLSAVFFVWMGCV